MLLINRNSCKQNPFCIPDFNSDEEKPEIIDIIDREVRNRFDNLGKGGFSMEDETVVAKHENIQNCIPSVCKSLSVHPESQAHNAEILDLKLSNKAINDLKKHASYKQTKKCKFDNKKVQAAAEVYTNQFIHILLNKLINSRLLNSIDDIISVSKEAVVYHAYSNPLLSRNSGVPKECAVKVYKPSLSDIKQTDFKVKIGKHVSRRTFEINAENEMINLKKMKKAEIVCPKVIALKRGVLVTSFIGKHHKLAPTLKYASLTEDEYSEAYHQVNQ